MTPMGQGNTHISNDSDDVPMDFGEPSLGDLPPFVPPPRHVDSPKLEPTVNEHQSKRARVEEVEDKETCPRYVRKFPTSSEELGDSKTAFENIFEEQRERCELPWAPFADNDEWELARWLAKNVNQRPIEEFLKMLGVSFVSQILGRILIDYIPDLQPLQTQLLKQLHLPAEDQQASYRHSVGMQNNQDNQRLTR
jgi:hypothetical protein